MSNLLITGIGGLTPRSIAKSVKKVYPQIKIIGIDMNPKAIGFYMDKLVDRYFVCPGVDSRDYWVFIKSLIHSEKIDLAFIQPEKEVIAWGEYYALYHEYVCPVLIPPIEISTVLVDKSKMAEVLAGTEFIPNTIKVTQRERKKSEVSERIGYPCWIRATKGSGGFGSLKICDESSFDAWLSLHKEIEEFTISEYLSGRHLATQMLYYEGEYIKGASLECVEYVMSNISPSKVTGSTSFGRFINEESILRFCDECTKYICKIIGKNAHGVLSYDLKEDRNGKLKVTEVNIRHMAYTGVMADIGFDLIKDTLDIIREGHCSNIKKQPFFRYDRKYIFLRDVDIEPIILEEGSSGKINSI